MATLRHPIFLSFLGGALFALSAYGEAASSIQDAPVLVKAKTMFSLGELGPIEPDIIRAAVRTTLEKVKEQLETNKPVVYLSAIL
jgi:hypothetical protein